METFWASFRLDPRQPRNAPLRASDADREIVRIALADAYADGRLNRDEYDGRLTTLYGTLTLGEMPSLVSDLVPADDSPADLAPTPGADLRKRGASKWRRDVEESLAGFLVPSIICAVIWIAVGHGGFFWPVFPMVFLGLNFVKTVVRRESIIEAEVRRLEKKAAKKALANAKEGSIDSDEPAAQDEMDFRDEIDFRDEPDSPDEDP